MEISEVRVKLIANPTDRLKAFASVTLDGDFVVRDIKIIDGSSGVFVAMPSRKLADRCPNCGAKNHLRAKYCNECGTALPKDRTARDRRGHTKLHADIAHPINSECRQHLQQRIVDAYTQELEQAKEPGYEPLPDDEYEDAGEDVEQHSGPTATDDAPTDDASTDDASTDDDSDYDSLIKDLKRDAAARQETRSRPQQVSSEPHDEHRKHDEPAPAASPGPASDPATGPVEPTTPNAEPASSPSQDAAPPDDFGIGIV